MFLSLGFFFSDSGSQVQAKTVVRVASVVKWILSHSDVLFMVRHTSVLQIQHRAKQSRQNANEAGMSQRSLNNKKKNNHHWDPAYVYDVHTVWCIWGVEFTEILQWKSSKNHNQPSKQTGAQTGICSLSTLCFQRSCTSPPSLALKVFDRTGKKHTRAHVR